MTRTLAETWIIPNFLKYYKSDIFISQREKRGHKGHKVRRRRFFVSFVALCAFSVKIMSLWDYFENSGWRIMVYRALPCHHKVHQHQKGDYTRRDDDYGFCGDSLLGMHRACSWTFWVVYTMHARFARRFMWFHTSDVLFTKNGYSLGFDGIAPFARAIPNSDEIRERICRVRGTGDTGQTGIGKGTTKIFGIRAIGQFYRNFALNAIPWTQLGNGTHFEKMFKIIPTIG